MMNSPTTVGLIMMALGLFMMYSFKGMGKGEFIPFLCGVVITLGGCFNLTGGWELFV